MYFRLQLGALVGFSVCGTKQELFDFCFQNRRKCPTNTFHTVE